MLKYHTVKIQTVEKFVRPTVCHTHLTYTFQSIQEHHCTKCPFNTHIISIFIFLFCSKNLFFSVLFFSLKTRICKKFELPLFHFIKILNVAAKIKAIFKSIQRLALRWGLNVIQNRLYNCFWKIYGISLNMQHCVYVR